MPPIVAQLNLYMDHNRLIRVKSKCGKMKQANRFARYNFPILLPKDSCVTNKIILDAHERYFHAGCYTLLGELRRKFWIPHFFSVVKKVLRCCVSCRRLNNRPIKLNQSHYRIERLDPVQVPFAQVYMDFLGPYSTKANKQRDKVYILCITCMWSRAINLLVCTDLTTKEFLRSFQIHCFEFGVPQKCVSDLGLGCRNKYH